MSLSPALARSIAASLLSPEELEWVEGIAFNDAGHGYDTFGLHPAHVALGLGMVMPLYRRYFRVLSYGEERIPRAGSALLAANHSGTVPVDGAMLWADVLLRSRRVLRPIADHFVPTLPWIGSLFMRGGVVGGARGNAQTLLDTGELVVIFPEGVPGIGKNFSERYQLQDWRVGHAELAIRHSTPVVPVALVGPEEQMPQLTKIQIPGKIFGFPHIPVPLTPIPLPVRYHIHYGEPLPFDRDYRPEEADDPATVRAAAGRVKAAVATLLEEGLEMRSGVFD